MSTTSAQKELPTRVEEIETRPRSSDDASFGRGVLTLGGGSMVTILVLLVEAVIIARTLSVGDLGLFAFFQASLALLIIVVDLGFKTSAAQLIARRTGPLQERVTNGLMTIRFAAIGGISVLILLARVPLSRLFNAPGAAELFLLMPLVLLFASLDELEGSLLRGFGYFQRVAAANILRGASRLVISSLVLLVLGWGLTGLIVSWMVSYAASFAFQWIAVPVRRRLWFRWSWARPVIRFSFPLQVTRYLWFGVARTQTLILALLVGPIAVAFYEVAARIPQGFHGLLQALYAVYHPTVARHFSRHETQAASMLIRRSLRLFYLATILTAWGAVLFGEDIIVVLFGAQYEAATPAFVVLMLALSLSASADLFGYAITGLGRTGRSMSVNALRAAASVGGGFLLVPYFGFIGAAISIALAQLISAPLAWLHLHREGLPTFLGIHMRQLLLVAACVVGMILLPPLGIASRVILFLIFAVLAAAFLSISRHDFALVLPEKLLQRVWPKRLVPSQLESSGE